MIIFVPIKPVTYCSLFEVGLLTLVNRKKGRINSKVMKSEYSQDDGKRVEETILCPCRKEESE
jgi:hypothetical protein